VLRALPPQEAVPVGRIRGIALVRAMGGLPCRPLDPNLLTAMPNSPLPEHVSPSVPGGSDDVTARPCLAPPLDLQALQRLQELDSSGTGALVARVVAAFDTSIARLVPQLQAAEAAADAAGIRYVTHTLKSSSQIVGAVRLSQQCAEIEALAKEGRIDGMHERINELCAEVAAVLDALKHLPASHP
jgi:HPt (histidine-containing phosphotransfer) domain-containing protein